MENRRQLINTCLRYNEQDKILISLKPDEYKGIDVNGIFDDGVAVIELYTGQKQQYIMDWLNFQN